MSTQQQLRLGIHPSVVLISPGAAVYDAVWPMRAHSLLSATPSSSWLQPAPPSHPVVDHRCKVLQYKADATRTGHEERERARAGARGIFLEKRRTKPWYTSLSSSSSFPNWGRRRRQPAGQIWEGYPTGWLGFFTRSGPGGTVYPVEEGLYRGDGPLIALFLLLLVVPHSPTVARVGLGRK